MKIKIKFKKLTKEEKMLIYDAVKQVIRKIRYERKKAGIEGLSYLIDLK